MERYQRIIQHELYKNAYESIYRAEENREFCHHDMEHFLAVARLTYIFVLEQNLPMSKDIVYALGFLHDIGRCKEYENGTPHEEAGIEIAREILPACGYNQEECSMILQIIGDHRNKECFLHPCSAVFYQADKISRNCQECKAYHQCYWSEEKKNHKYTY
ncbi:MAG: HD domain-containing protein [Anaerostipes sp.]|nr:HD domain-containing protein [Anaerostipes sp.]